MSFSDEQDGRGNGASNEEYGPFTEIGCRRPDINVRKNVESQPQNFRPLAARYKQRG